MKVKSFGSNGPLEAFHNSDPLLRFHYI